MSLWIGEHVKLRRMAADDWRVLLEWAEDSEAQRIGGIVSGPQSEARMREHTTESAKQTPEDESLWLMVTLLDGTPVGSVQTRDVNVRNGTFDYGVDIARKYWGRGYGGEALAMLLRFYFDERRFQKANGQVFAFNEQSKRFHEKFGFQLEGTLRRNWFAGGKHHDVLCYGMTADEFRARYGEWQPNTSKPAAKSRRARPAGR
jgi:RimJ/RimL family protein N-acetyltransferase